MDSTPASQDYKGAAVPSKPKGLGSAIEGVLKKSGLTKRYYRIKNIPEGEECKKCRKRIDALDAKFPFKGYDRG